MDTKSLVISLETDDLVSDVALLQEKYEMFDFTNLVKNFELHEETNDKVLGEFEMENPDSLKIFDFASSGAKTHAYSI